MIDVLNGIARDELQVRADDRNHVFHSWSAQALIDPMPIASAQGSYFTDYSGQRYLDFSSQLVNVNIGYQHPRLVAAIQEQASRLCTIAPSFANDARSEAARLIAEIAPGDLNQVFFTNGGAEATENALRIARVHTGRHKVLAAYRSYHGATAGAMAMTGDPRRWGRPSTPRPKTESASALSSICATSSLWRVPTRSPRSSSNRSSGPMESWCPRTAISPGSARSVTSSGS
jgi:taurine--2-oxoglutarate transaminase